MKFLRALRAVRTAAAILLLSFLPSPAAADPGRDMLERSRCVARSGGCNGCPTAGCAEQGRRGTESDWLEGDTLGCRGAGGTTHPTVVHGRRA